jgi:hypothetical protein
MDVGTNQYKRKGGKDMNDKMLITIFCDVDDFCTNLVEKLVTENISDDIYSGLNSV